MAGCLRPPPASSGEEAENRGVTAAQKPRQSGPSPALPTVTLFATAACRLIGLLGGHYPASLFASGTPSHPEPQPAGRSLGFRITKFMRKLAGWSALIRSSLPQRCQLRSRRLPILKLSGHPFRSSPTPDTSCFASRQFALNKPDCPPFEAITPSEGTRPASCRAGQGCGSSAASHLSTSRKALRASAGRRNAQLPRPCLYACHLLSFFQLFAFHCLSRRVIWTLRPCANRF